MLDAIELAMLRTKLWHVNVEYSALVRDKQREGRFVRMGELKNERQALMALISLASKSGPWRVPYWHQAIEGANPETAGALRDA